MLKIVEDSKHKAKIKVIGVGGAGCNALNKMISSDIEGVEYIAVNTDAQALSSCLAKERIQIGRNATCGLGAGGSPELGKQAAIEDEQLIAEMFDETEIAFLTAGLGGGTGTGATPVIARIAQEKGILTVAIVTKPFLFEGSIKQRQAEEGLKELKNTIDTVMTIPNQKLFELAGDSLTMVEAFSITDNLLLKSVQAISRLILKPGMINLDFAHIRAVMSIKGAALLGFGEGEGKGKAIQAMKQAIASPMMEEREIKGAKGVLISLLSGPDLMLFELNDAVEIVRQLAAPEANIIFGANVEPEMTDRAIITLIATGIEPEKIKQQSLTKTSKEKNQREIDLPFIEPKQPKESHLVRGEKIFYKGQDLDEPAIWRQKRKESLI